MLGLVKSFRKTSPGVFKRIIHNDLIAVRKFIYNKKMRTYSTICNKQRAFGVQLHSSLLSYGSSLYDKVRSFMWAAGTCFVKLHIGKHNETY